MTVENAFRGVRKVFIDTAPTIYALATNNPFTPISQTALAYCMQEGVALSTSPVTLAECLAGETDLGRQALFVRYLATSSAIVMSPLDADVAMQAAVFRRTTKLKLPDCLQPATALAAGCDAFLTNDAQLAKTSVPLRFLLVSDLEP